MIKGIEPDFCFPCVGWQAFGQMKKGAYKYAPPLITEKIHTITVVFYVPGVLLVQSGKHESFV